MMKNRDKLTGLEYLILPATELVNHPDFSPHAHRVMLAISQMTTEKIENLDIIGGMK